jgi:RNA-directed DNA polymerase
MCPLSITSPGSLRELAAALGVSEVELRYWTLATPNRYTSFAIPKRRGGTRLITAPVPRLRLLQARLLRLLASIYRPHSSVHGFVAGRGILSNAIPHVRRRFVLNVDLKNFFDTINFGRVRGALISKPYMLDPRIATIIARLCCKDNALPQGAPTSPILANMVCLRLDGELSRLGRAFKCRYTRYADDITFSSNHNDFPRELAALILPPYGTHATVGDSLGETIRSNGFLVNAEKTRLYHKANSQRVTGLTVNRKPNVSRTYIRSIRGMLNAWQRYGYDRAQEEYRRSFASRVRAPWRRPPTFRSALLGKMNYLAMIKGRSDPVFIALAKKCRQLDGTLFNEVLDGNDAVDSAVWVVECVEKLYQGTGFFLQDVGFVTCAHVLGSQIEVFHPERPVDRRVATVVARDDHLDIAILYVPGSTPESLQMVDSVQIKRDKKILVAGWPGFAPGHTMYKHWGTVTMSAKRHGVRYIVPSAAIAEGNSGGPVLDQHFRVIGIASRGINEMKDEDTASPDQYGAIVIDEIRRLRKSI